VLNREETLESENSLPDTPTGHFGDNIDKSTSKGFVLFLCIALTVIIGAVYMQVGNHPFFGFDDADYVTNNPYIENGITGKSLVWALTSVEAYNWHPVTWLSHISVAHFFGMDPRTHHLTNVAIHILATLLLFLLLFRLTDALWQSLFVAALFALHPLHVESVAWVAERKDVLSALFCFLTLHFYSHYVSKRKPLLYLLALLSFVLGLMSKSMLVTLPALMLLMDYWPLCRLQPQCRKQAEHHPRDSMAGCIREKLPFFACSLISAVITIYAQNKGGVVRGLQEIPFLLRCENALVAYVTYIGKTLWPHNLAFFYPFPVSIPLWKIAGSLLIMLVLSVAAIRTRHSFPYLAVGWFWFLITLVPVIGLIQVGGQSMADRYTYIPITGLFMAATWGASDLLKVFRYRKAILALIAGAVIFASILLTWRQIGYWRDNISVYQHTLHVTSGDYLIHSFLGAALADNGELDAALHEHSEALRLHPNDTTVHYNLALALVSAGEPEPAIREFQAAILLDPNNVQAHNSLGLALADRGYPDEAIKEFREALRVSPGDTKVHNNLGIALARKGSLEAAIHEFQEALLVSPNNAKAHNNLEHAFVLRKMLNRSGK
jgi:Flp pilus assembly protein TadD